MTNLFEMKAKIKNNDGTEKIKFKVIQVESYEGFLEAIWYFARTSGLSGYKKSKRSKLHCSERKIHKHFYDNGTIRVMPLKPEIYL